MNDLSELPESGISGAAVERRHAPVQGSADAGSRACVLLVFVVLVLGEAARFSIRGVTDAGCIPVQPSMHAASTGRTPGLSLSF